MMRFKPTSKIASMKFAMEGKTPGEPIATQIPKTQKRKRFSLASSGGGGRADAVSWYSQGIRWVAEAR